MPSLARSGSPVSAYWIPLSLPRLVRTDQRSDRCASRVWGNWPPPDCESNSANRSAAATSPSLVLASKAAGAEIKPFRLASYHDGGGVNIGHPASVGVTLGVADIMTELRCFAA